MLTWATAFSFVYTILWSISFYGQCYENCIHQSVQGMSLDFLVLNICGFVFYAIYSTIGFFTDIKGAGTVVLGDLIFAYHALVMVLIWLVQAVIYPKGKNRLSRRTLIICIGLWGFVGAQFFLTTILNIIPWTEYFNPVSSLGYGKLILTVIKYIPVAYWNYVRQSTFGWSICGVLCDFSGGFISLISGILSTEKGFNMSKLGLGLISIAYDLLFVIQHYCFYHENTTEQRKLKSKEKASENSYIDEELETQTNTNEEIVTDKPLEKEIDTS